MCISFGVRVVDKNGRGIKNAKVFMSYPFTQQQKYTNSDGWAHFTRPETMYDGVRADIIIEGHKVADNVWIKGGGTFSFTR